MQDLFDHQNILKDSINDFGKGFQILDDVNSINDSNFAALKGACDDIKEGKLSYPILKFFQDSQNYELKKELENILNIKRGSEEDLSRVKSILSSGNAFKNNINN